MWKTMDEQTLKSKKVADLREIAKTFGLEGYEKMKKAELVAALMKDDEPAEEKTAAPAEEPQVEENRETLDEPHAKDDGAAEETARDKARARKASGRREYDNKNVVPDKDDRF